MQYQQLYQGFRERLLFSLDDIRQRDPSFDKSRLYEWLKKGYMSRLVRGFYYFLPADFNEARLFKAANTVYRPSYVSLESALSYHGLIPEKPLAVTSVSTLKTASFNTPQGRLTYRKVAPKYFSGYHAAGEGYYIASPEKALLDYFYLNGIKEAEETIRGMRLNRAAMRERINARNLNAAAKRFNTDETSVAAKIIGGML